MSAAAEAKKHCGRFWMVWKVFSSRLDIIVRDPHQPANFHAFGGFPKQIFSISLFQMASRFFVESNILVESRKRGMGKASKCMLGVSGGPCPPV